MSLPAEPQGAGALGQPRGMEWGGRREEGSGWGTHVYLIIQKQVSNILWVKIFTAVLFIVAKLVMPRDFPGGPVVKNLPANAGDRGSIPGQGRSHVLWSN